ncbi:hypothetical protein BDV59DRAFT_194731 [Aspergillus ambiguus]|uniref:uncharacterized protein n=1 Tax=Aspergillus ambiguus TaxID=176160 RepID=UPI003CCDC0D2
MGDTRLEPSSRHANTCFALEKWTSSGSYRPAVVAPGQHLWQAEAIQGYTLSPSHSPTGAIPEDVPRLFSSFEDDWHSAMVISTSSQLKPGLRYLHEPKACSDWTWDSEGSTSSDMQRDSSYSSGPATGAHNYFSEAANQDYAATTLIAPSSTISSPSYLHSKRGDHSPTAFTPGTGCDDRRLSSDDTEEDSNGEPPYSLLIYRALRSAPGMKLPLQGIYSWFEKNTAKGKDRNSKGWQNSIRHNLSMNAGFEAVREESTPGKKAVNFWRLTDEAVEKGIQSTTRYRKQANYKKALGSEPPAPQRQRSGAKGGKAAKFTAKFRGSMGHDELRKERTRQRFSCQRRPHKDVYGQYRHPSSIATPSMYHVSLGSATPLPRTSAESFDLGSVVGCADPPCTPIFCDMAGSGPDCLALDTGFLGLNGIQPFPQQGMFKGSEVTTDVHFGV